MKRLRDEGVRKKNIFHNHKIALILLAVVMLSVFAHRIAIYTETESMHDVIPDFSILPLPFPVEPYSGNPVMTREMVTDVNAAFVGDPFLFVENGVWYMFFEVFNLADNSKSIGLSTSFNGFIWEYQHIVLNTEPSMAYPYVFKADGNYYMVPDLNQNIINIYKALNFPYDWVIAKTIQCGEENISDPSVIYHEGLWWILATRGRQMVTDLHIFYASSIEGDWTEHVLSPVFVDDGRTARGGGRIGYYNGTLIRFAQKCDVTYGELVNAIQIDVLNTTHYAHHELTTFNPIIESSDSGWNNIRMHHFDPWWNGTNYICATEGGNGQTYSIGIYYTTSNTTLP